MRFLKLSYRYTGGSLAKVIYNLAHVTRIQVVESERGHSKIVIEQGNHFDYLMFKTAVLAREGFEDLTKALRNPDYGSLRLETGFADPILEVDSDELEEVQ